MDFEDTQEGTNYVTNIRSKLTDDLSANYQFLSALYNQRKKFVDENWDRVINILEKRKMVGENEELVAKLYHYTLQQYAFLYWLKEGYFTEQAQKLDKQRSEKGIDDKFIFNYIGQEELDELGRRITELDSLIEGIMVKEE